MSVLDDYQRMLGGAGVPVAPLDDAPTRLMTGGALGQSGQPAGWTPPDYVLNYMQDMLSGKIANQGALGARYQEDPDNPLGRVMDIVMGIGPGAIRAYHGSPHSFDRFDLSKIGTGEGAQAYGHGLYFAENEGVARGYRESLANPQLYVGSNKVGEIGALGSDPTANAAHALLVGGNPQAAKAQVREAMKRQAEGGYGYSRQLGDDILKAIDDIGSAPIERRPGGHMYEVDIHADPKAFLDWDRSLAGQSPEVLTALQQKLGQPAGLPPGYRLRQTGSGDYMVADDLGMGVTGKGGVVARGRTPEEALRLYLPSGEEVYQGLAQKLGGRREQVTPAGSYDLPYSSEAQASERLREAGIPGVRYFDQGSRGTGQGTSNYAIFDPSIIEILRKYGILPPTVATGGLLATREEPPT